jgi:hypothetical protein
MEFKYSKKETCKINKQNHFASYVVAPHDTPKRVKLKSLYTVYKLLVF